MRAIATHPAARGLNDDAAVLDVGGETLVLTHDTMVEGVHFLPGQDPADVAWKLVATNMSDLAAKGAQPLAVLLSYQLGRDDAAFLHGLQAALQHYGEAALLGGDTVRAPGPQCVGLTAIGRATHRPVPSRGGAAGGDPLRITRPCGAGLLGLEALKAGTGDSTAYRRPTALLTEGQMLAPLVSAIMDVSDGVLLDASRMADASGVTIAVDRMAVPIAAPEVRRDEALRWGDDYQLLFTLPNGITPPCPAFRIGTVLERQGAPILLDGAPVSGRLGYEHG